MAEVLKGKFHDQVAPCFVDRFDSQGETLPSVRTTPLGLTVDLEPERRSANFGYC